MSSDARGEARYSVFGKGVVGVAVQPPFARFSGGDDRVCRCPCMFARVTVGRTVTAQGEAALLTGAEMHPPCADLHTLLALMPLRTLDSGDSGDVGAGFSRHRESPGLFSEHAVHE